MSGPLIMHIDDAPWVRGGPRGQGDHPDGGGQLIGDLEQGPWVHVNWLPPNLVAPPHHHDHAETMYILEGGFEFDGQSYGPGTVIHLEAGTEYGFTVSPSGVRFLNIRTGKARYTESNSTPQDPYTP